MKASLQNAYRVHIGSALASSKTSESRRQLLQLCVLLDMDGPGAACTVELADSNVAPPAAGDPVTVELDAGDGAQTVFTGTVTGTEVRATGQTVIAHGALAELGRSEVEGAYDSVSADFIIKDLIGKVGAAAGSISKGPELSGWALHRGPTALGHLRRLALLCGADLFAGGDGKIHCAVPKAGAADHHFKFGETVIRLDVHQRSPAFDSIEVWGEGAASAKGADKAHWLSTDLAGVSAKAAVGSDGQVQAGKLGARPFRLREGALRSGESVEAVAKAWATSLAARLLGGSLEVFAAPKVQPGDLVAIDNLPADHAAASLLGQGSTLRVRQVRHRLDRQRGTLTRLGF
ncbi:MAG: hypothetical protein JSR69_12460 [Proteobacteria bacterium]|nr:hypothetical protein [Pseudomonadota bacterium]